MRTILRHFPLQILLLLLLLAGCRPDAPLPEAPMELLTPQADPAGPEAGLNITADPRLELLAAVQLISGYDRQTGLITREDFAYKEEVRRYFEPFRKHAAVRLFDRMSRSGFSFDAPPAVMLYLTPPPELAVHTPLTPYLIGRAGGAAPLNEFLAAMRDFARQSDFMSFYNQHQEFYAQMSAGVSAMLPGEQDLEVLEDYYGLQEHSYNLVLVPLFHAGGFGPRVSRADGTFDLYSINGPHGVSKEGEIPTFGTTESYRYLIWHEFAHSFVNPLTEAHQEEVLAHEELYRSIRGAMEDQAYTDWISAVNEHIVRAVTVRLAYRELGEAAGQAALEEELDRGFVYIEGLLDKLEIYEAQRDRYPTFTSFYPELIFSFSEAAGGR
jgi:hypothetical protein